MIKHKLNFTMQLCRCVFLLPVMLSLSACGQKMAPASITGYNHTKDRSIYSFTVNGAIGSNLAPSSGGGKSSCCVSIPYKWRVGLKAKIAWEYQGGTEIPPPPPKQEIEIDIPEYKVPGDFHVHFYDNHKIKIVISGCSINHPFYPMSKQDKVPWEPFTSVAEAIESQKRGGMNNDC